MCDSPHENVAQGAQWQFYLGATSAAPLPLYAPLGSPVGTFFGSNGPQCICTVTVMPLCGHCAPKVVPKTAQGAQKESKSYFLGA